jgi:hypothetical protein
MDRCLVIVCVQTLASCVLETDVVDALDVQLGPSVNHFQVWNNCGETLQGESVKMNQL